MSLLVTDLVHVGREDDAAERSASGVNQRQKADERARSERRRVLICDGALILDRALHRSRVTETVLADMVGVSQQTVSQWRREPIDRQTPLYGLLGHQGVTVEAVAAALERVEMQASTGEIDVEPISEAGLIRVLSVANKLLARRRRT